MIDEYGVCKKHQTWFARIIRYAQAGKCIRLPPGNALRNYLHVVNAADSMIFAYEQSKSGTWNACGTSLTCHEVAIMAYDIFGSGGEVVVAKEKTPFHEIEIPNNDNIVENLPLHSLLSVRDCLEMIKKYNTAKEYGDFDVE